jgi:hypothetical protein
MATWKVLEGVEFLPGLSDPEGLAIHDVKLISYDAGIHPPWPTNDSRWRVDFFRSISSKGLGRTTGSRAVGLCEVAWIDCGATPEI